MDTKLWHKLAPYVFKDNGIFWGELEWFFHLHVVWPSCTIYHMINKSKMGGMQANGTFCIMTKVGVFFSFEIIHVLLNLLPQPPATPKEVETWNWTKLNTLEKDLLGTLEKVLRNNMKKIRMLLNYEAGKEVPIQQKNVSMTQLGCYSLFFSLNAHSIHSVSLSIMKTWA